MVPPYEVLPYHIDTLLRLLAERSHADPQSVAGKLQSVYFGEYFIHKNAETILVEADYTDRDFLEDYAAYYVRCFAEYPRKCTRLHFFDVPFDESALAAIVGGTSNQVGVEVHRLCALVRKESSK